MTFKEKMGHVAIMQRDNDRNGRIKLRETYQ